MSSRSGNLPTRQQQDSGNDSDSSTDDGCVRNHGIICTHTDKYREFLEVYGNREYASNSAEADDRDLPTRAAALMKTRMALLRREKVL